MALDDASAREPHERRCQVTERLDEIAPQPTLAPSGVARSPVILGHQRHLVHVHGARAVDDEVERGADLGGGFQPCRHPAPVTLQRGQPGASHLAPGWIDQSDRHHPMEVLAPKEGRELQGRPGPGRDARVLARVAVVDQDAAAGRGHAPEPRAGRDGVVAARGERPSGDQPVTEPVEGPAGRPGLRHLVQDSPGLAVDGVEAVVVDQVGVQATVTTEVDVFEEQPEQRRADRWTGRRGVERHAGDGGGVRSQSSVRCEGG